MLLRKIFFICAVASLALFGLGNAVQAQPIQVFTSIGPNPVGPGSPGFRGAAPVPTGVGGGGYATFATPPGTGAGNALLGLFAGNPNFNTSITGTPISSGNPSITPGAYTNLSGTPGGFVQIAPQAFLTSPQNSWGGQLNPGTVFGPGFASEQGNFVFFGLRVDGNNAGIGGNFNLANLTLDLSTPTSFFAPFTIPSASIFPNGYDTPGLRAFDAAGNLLTGAFEAPNVENVRLAYFSGVGLSNSGATIADALNQILGLVAANDGLEITGTYNLAFGQGNNVSGSATFEIVPEPTSLAVWAGIAGALGAFRLARRRFTVSANS